MIHALNLAWIVPACVAVGFMLAAWLLTDEIDPGDY